MLAGVHNVLLWSNLRSMEAKEALGRPGFIPGGAPVRVPCASGVSVSGVAAGSRKCDRNSGFSIRLLEDLKNLVEGVADFSGIAEVHHEAAITVGPRYRVAVRK